MHVMYISAVNSAAILGTVGALLATVGIMGWLLYQGISLFFRVRPHLRGHVFAAALWTAVTIFQTTALLLDRGNKSVIGQAVATVAGFVMIASWAQFAERQSGATYRQEKRPLLTRLFVQSLWGLLALWATAFAIGVAGDDWFNHALASRDVTTVSRLRAVGFGKSYDDSNSFGEGGYWRRQDALMNAIRAQDEIGVRLYLAAGAPADGTTEENRMPLEAAVHRPNTRITELLFAGGEPELKGVSLLIEAVRSGQVEQVRLLLRRGADPGEIDVITHFSALQIAKKHGNQPMIALLKGAGAIK